MACASTPSRRGDRHALPRHLLDAGDAQGVRVGDSARPPRDAGGMRERDRVPRLAAASYMLGETIDINGGQLMR